MLLEGHNGFILKQVDDRLTNMANRMLQKYDITSSQVHTLVFLADRRGEHTSLRDIEAYLCVAHPTIIGLVRRLEQKGFVTVKVDDRDHRYRQVDITDKGYEVFEQTLPIAEEIEGIITKGMSKEEAKKVSESLQTILDNLTEYDTKERAGK